MLVLVDICVAVAVGVLVCVAVLVGSGVFVGCGVAVGRGVLVGAGVAVGAAVQATSRMNGIRMRMNARDTRTPGMPSVENRRLLFCKPASRVFVF